MRVGTYNVYEFRDRHANENMGGVIDTIELMDCDVVGLQEVPLTERSGYYGDESDESDGSYLDGYLSDALSVRAITASASQGLGNTLLVRGKASGVRRVDLWRHGSPMRSAAMAYVPSDVGRVNVCTVHLDDRREMARLEQFRALEAELSWRGPSLVFGDFNALRESDYDERRWDEIEQARSEAGIEWARHELTAYIDSLGWVDLVRLGVAGSMDRYADSLRRPMPRGLTETSRYGTRVDYVWATPDLARKVRVTAFEVVPSDASDHRPVVVEIEPLRQKKRRAARSPSAA